LNRLQDSQRSTVRHEIQEAVVSYEEKARDQWLFECPAQVALTGSQIWWSVEVSFQTFTVKTLSRNIKTKE